MSASAWGISYFRAWTSRFAVNIWWIAASKVSPSDGPSSSTIEVLTPEGSGGLDPGTGSAGGSLIAGAWAIGAAAMTWPDLLGRGMRPARLRPPIRFVSGVTMLGANAPGPGPSLGSGEPGMGPKFGNSSRTPPD